MLYGGSWGTLATALTFNRHKGQSCQDHRLYVLSAHAAGIPETRCVGSCWQHSLEQCVWDIVHTFCEEWRHHTGHSKTFNAVNSSKVSDSDPQHVSIQLLRPYLTNSTRADSFMAVVLVKIYILAKSGKFSIKVWYYSSPRHYHLQPEEML